MPQVIADDDEDEPSASGATAIAVGGDMHRAILIEDDDASQVHSRSPEGNQSSSVTCSFIT